MSTKFYSGQKDYIIKLNEMDQAFQDAMSILTGSNSTPLALGTASAGISGLFSRADHVHPTAGLALLSGANFTGSVTVPDKASGTNDGSAANTKFVQSAIASLVNSSPAALDTLNELAAALGNDANFATTMTNALSLKANAANSALTGTTSIESLTFSGTGRRITGDFTTPTLANRVLFQTSTTNGLTGIGILPNGTSTTALLNLYAGSDPANASFFQSRCDGATSQLISSANGTGTILPISVQIGGTEALRIDTSRNVSIASGNLTFSGAGQRITGDFSNGTIANRVLFQTSAANSATSVGAIPNGIGGSANFVACNGPDPANASRALLYANATEIALRSDVTGTGTYLPLLFFTNGAEAMRIDTSRNVSIASGYLALKTAGKELRFYNAAGNNWTAVSSPCTAGDTELDFKVVTKSGTLYMDASGNLGLGATLAAHAAGTKVLQLSDATLVAGDVNTGYFGNNFYFTSSSPYFKRMKSGYAARYYVSTLDGSHHWQTAGTAAANSDITFADAMTLDNNGNLGLGVTPSTWTGGYKVLELSGCSLGSSTSNEATLFANMYRSGGNWLLRATAGAGYYSIVNGVHSWAVAPSAAAGSIASVSTAMTLDNSGNFSIGLQIPASDIAVPSGRVHRILHGGYGASAGSQAVIQLSGGYGNSGTSGSRLIKAVYDGGANGSNSLQFTRMASFTGAETVDMTLDNSGVLMVGQTSSVGVKVQIGGFNDGAFASSTGLGVAGNSHFQGALRVDGNLLVGTTTSNGAKAEIIGAGGGNGALRIKNTTNANLDVGLMIQLGSATNNASSYFIVGQEQGVQNRFFVLGNGNLQNLNNSYGAISDLKLKENITDATPKLDDLMKVRIVNYNLKTDPDHRQLGAIAQELEQIFPGMVEETPDLDADGKPTGETTKAVKYSVFVPMLVKAMQEQQEIINKLTQRIEQLEAK